MGRCCKEGSFVPQRNLWYHIADVEKYDSETELGVKYQPSKTVKIEVGKKGPT
jgi:hypothetical protein